MADESESVGKIHSPKEKNELEEVVGASDLSNDSFEDAVEQLENDQSFTESDSFEVNMNEEDILCTDSSRKHNSNEKPESDMDINDENNIPNNKFCGEQIMNGNDTDDTQTSEDIALTDPKPVSEDLAKTEAEEVNGTNEGTDNGDESDEVGTMEDEGTDKLDEEKVEVDSDEIEVIPEDSPQEEEEEEDDEEGNILDNMIMYESPGGIITVLETQESHQAHGHDVAPPEEDGDSDGSGDSDGVIMFKPQVTSPEDHLPETVTKLETEEGCKVYIVGTAHFSEQSQDDVAKTIQAIQPDVVMVELCKSRVEILMYDEAFLLKEVENMNLQKFKMCIKQNGVVGGLMHLLLLNMSAHISKQIGMAPGGEFRRAFHEHKKVPGCQFHLGDRPVQVTLSRVMGALSLWQKMCLGWHLITSNENITKEDIEKGKEKDFLAEMLAEMVGDFPKLYEVFVSERDKYMAHTLQMAASPIYLHKHEESGIVYYRKLTKVVAVVGIGHAQGIKDNWGKQIDIQDLLVVPGPSRAGQLIRFFGKATVAVFVSWSAYKLFHWTNLATFVGNYVSLPEKIPFL